MINLELCSSLVDVVKRGYKVSEYYRSIYQEDGLYLVVSPIFLSGKIIDWHIKEYTNVEDAVKEFIK